jgi:hypothetical protein
MVDIHRPGGDQKDVALPSTGASDAFGVPDAGLALTATREGKELINEVAYALVDDLVPNELPFYVATRDRYFADPASFRRQPAVDRELDFGVAEIIHTFTGTILPLLTPILAYLLAQAAAALQEKAAEQALDWVLGLFTKPEPTFTVDQLRLIEREIVAITDSESARLRLDPAQVRAFKDAILVRLALCEKQP